jgi:hypothetical protein
VRRKPNKHPLTFPANYLEVSEYSPIFAPYKEILLLLWKIQSELTPRANVILTPKNFSF